MYKLILVYTGHTDLIVAGAKVNGCDQAARMCNLTCDFTHHIHALILLFHMICFGDKVHHVGSNHLSKQNNSVRCSRKKTSLIKLS